MTLKRQEVYINWKPLRSFKDRCGSHMMLSINKNIVPTDKPRADLFRYIDFKARNTSRSNLFVLRNEP